MMMKIMTRRVDDDQGGGCYLTFAPPILSLLDQLLLWVPTHQSLAAQVQSGCYSAIKNFLSQPFPSLSHTFGGHLKIDYDTRLTDY